MFIRRKRRWESPERDVTPEALFWNRRAVLTGGAALAGAGSLGLGLGLGLGGAMAPSPAAAALAAPGTPFDPRPSVNPAFADAGRPVTDPEVNGSYNNFYEFGSHKRIFEAAQALRTDAWTLTIDGLVEQEQTLAVDELIAAMPLEERIVRHRCVEAWAMVAPWIGFPLKALLDRAAPLASAKYVRFETFVDPGVASGQRQFWYPWPYVEGLTIAEAANELSFMVVGAYGQMLPQQYGAPIRLHTPWKYGFKSIKSIRRISFVEERPVSFWEALQSSEYGFWANVNPEVDHPRWSQATERMLGTDERVPTLLYNGYGEEVASLYSDLAVSEGDRLWR